MAQALAQAANDPGLRGWFEREQAMDAAVAAKLAEVRPPAGLREAILAGGRVSAAPRRTVPMRWLALAAAVAVLLAVGVGVWTRGPASRPVELAALAKFAMSDVEGPHLGGRHASEMGATGAWLQDPANRLGGRVAVDEGELKADHCRELTVAGHRVFEICFLRERMYHIYIGERTDFVLGAGDDEPMFAQKGGVSFVSWADRSHVYVVAAQTGLDQLRGLF